MKPERINPIIKLHQSTRQEMAIQVRSYIRILAYMTCLVVSLPSQAWTDPAKNQIEDDYLGERAKTEYQLYQNSGSPRAFAIAPGGAWAWVADQTSSQQASEAALNNCEKHSNRCTMFAIDDLLVFKQKDWAALWSPYQSGEQAVRQRSGRGVGDRLFNLQYLDASGRPHSISGLHGKVVLVHFWASWCPPCAAELPSLLELHRALQSELSEQAEIVLLPVREPYSEARRWAEEQGFDTLPIYDSMYNGAENTIRLADGSSLPDRYIAQTFPSTYVIDKNGIILFSHNGPLYNWVSYLPLLRHAANANSSSMQ